MDKKEYIKSVGKENLVKELVAANPDSFSVEDAVDLVYDTLTLDVEDFRTKYQLN